MLAVTHGFLVLIVLARRCTEPTEPHERACGGGNGGQGRGHSRTGEADSKRPCSRAGHRCRVLYSDSNLTPFRGDHGAEYGSLRKDAVMLVGYESDPSRL